MLFESVALIDSNPTHTTEKRFTHPISGSIFFGFKSYPSKSKCSEMFINSGKDQRIHPYKFPQQLRSLHTQASNSDPPQFTSLPIRQPFLQTPKTTQTQPALIKPTPNQKPPTPQDHPHLHSSGSLTPVQHPATSPCSLGSRSALLSPVGGQPAELSSRGRIHPATTSRLLTSEPPPPRLASLSVRAERADTRVHQSSGTRGPPAATCQASMNETPPSPPPPLDTPTGGRVG